MRVKLALSTLCENPERPTGLSTLFPEFVGHARRLFPEVSWVVFVGMDAPWRVEDPHVEVVRAFASNESPVERLAADHLRVAPEARRLGCAALLTVGFHPLRDAGLPIAMHVFSVGHLGACAGARAAYRTWAVERGLAKAAVVIVNSEWTRSRLPKGRSPVVVSPEGIDHDVFRPDGPAGAPDVPGRYLLWVSNLYPYKRIELALAAYAGLPPMTRQTFPFVVAGGDWAGGLAKARDAAVGLGISGDVKFLGRVDDALLPALYRGAQAHVLSTSEETFGRTALEAMACGCPNVLQDLAVLREVAGGTAQYVDFGVPAAATAVLAQVCADPHRQVQLTQAGIARAAGFSFERLARERVSAVLAAIEKDVT